MPGVVLVRYGGNPPSDTALRQYLALETRPYTYIVATAALEKKRENLALAHQLVVGDDGNAAPQLVFHKALRHFIRQPILTRAEERVLLQRTLQAVAENPTLSRQLRHDVFAWRDALAELAARGTDLSAGIPSTLQDQLVNPSVGALLQQLQAGYRTLQLEEQRQSFEEVAYTFLRQQYSPTEYVIMEGFTFLTPLQQYYIERCVQRGATLYILHPYREEQAFGFQVMGRTFNAWQNEGIQAAIDTPFTASSNDLATLQVSLFGDISPGTSNGDGSVTIESYSHRHREVARCIERVQEYMENGTAAEDIAIVTRDIAAFQSLLQEEAALHNLPVTLGVPPRQLLLTPLGRFALTLYDIWRDGVLEITADQFEMILTSGWLGASVQATAELFTAVKAQMFARCRTRDDWQRSLDLLMQARTLVPARSRLSVRFVDSRTIDPIDQWREVIVRVETLCQQLFTGGPRSIGGHIQQLLDELTQLAPEQMLETEREVLERIRDALTQIAEAASLEMSAEEFGEILNSLVREYERAESEEGDSQPEQPGRIWVTTPEGIDGYSKDVVLFLGVDNQRSPRQYVEPWPLYAPDIDLHQEKERYLFLAVVRAARRHLHLSYAQSDEAGMYRASPYLEETAGVLGVTIVPETSLSTEAIMATSVVTRPLGRSRRQEYSLAEIAHFALCPFRYKLERLDKSAVYYRAPFQIQLVAQSAWLDMIMTHLRQQDAQAQGSGAVLQMFLQGLEATRGQVHNLFAGLRDLEWRTIENYVRGDLEYEAQRRSQYPVRIVAPGNINITVPEGDRTIVVTTGLRHALEVGRYRHPYLTDILREEWLIPGRSPGPGDPVHTEIEGVRVFADLSRAVQWWRNAVHTAFYYHATQNQQQASSHQPDFINRIRQDYIDLQEELRRWIALIEAGNYPKHEGPHNLYCPVRGNCLGLNP